MKRFIYQIKYMLWYDLNDIPLKARLPLIIFWTLWSLAFGFSIAEAIYN